MGAKNAADRPVHVYDVPAAVEGSVRSVALVELTASEELMAAQRSRSESARLAYELAKQSLVAVNGEKVSLADGSADKVWNTMPAAVRNLVLQAYAQVHAPPDGASDVFLASRQVVVG